MGIAAGQGDAAGEAAIEEYLSDFRRGGSNAAGSARSWTSTTTSSTRTGNPQRYRSNAIAGDEPFPPYDRDPELYYHPDQHPEQLPHAWLQHESGRVSTLDLVRDGRFTLITGLSGADWVRAADELAAEFGCRSTRTASARGSGTTTRSANGGDCAVSRTPAGPAGPTRGVVGTGVDRRPEGRAARRPDHPARPLTNLLALPSGATGPVCENHSERDVSIPDCSSCGCWSAD